jgi:hypothetical protein
LAKWIKHLPTTVNGTKVPVSDLAAAEATDGPGVSPHLRNRDLLFAHTDRYNRDSFPDLPVPTLIEEVG